jgi:outer membrane protein TolC
MKYSLLASFFLLSSLFGETISLDLSETTRRAINESEDYKIQKNEVVKSDYKTKETRSILFPQVTGELSYLDNIKFPELPHTKMMKNFNLDAGVNVYQIITTFGKISASINAMKKLTSMNRYQEQSVKDEVVFNSKLLYFNAYFAKRVLQISEESYENTLKSKNLLEKGSEKGRVSKRDNIKVAADVAARIPMIFSARSAYTTALESLKKAIGVESDVAIELTEGYRTNYENFSVQEAIANLERNQPILKALQQSINAQKDLVKSKRAEYFPTLSAFFRYNYKGSSDDYFVGNNTLFNYTAGGLNLQIPLFYGNRTRDKIKQSIADRDNAELTFKKTKKNLELELEKAITEYQELIQTLPANDEAVKLAEESFLLSGNLFSSGQLSTTDLDDAEMMLTNQKIKKETNLFKLQVALAKIERLTCIGTIHE